MSSNLLSSKLKTSKRNRVAVRIAALGALRLPWLTWPASLAGLAGLVGLAGLAALALLSLQSAAQAQNQGQNFDRQALIERFRQARANGTLGRGGMRAAGAGERMGGGQGGFSPQTNGGSPGMARQGFQRRQGPKPIDPAVWEKVDRRIDIAYGSGPLEKLDLYMPKDRGSARMPILIFLHGGGWRIGDKHQQGGKGALYAQNGIIFVNANYGLAPTVVHPQQVLDVAKCIKYCVDHAPEWGGDPERIFLMGHSAGAHLVDLVATNQRFLKEVGVEPTRIKGVISLDTASLDLLKRTQEESMEGKHVGSMIEQAFGKNPEMLKDGSPTLNIHKGAYYPPFLMYCGERRKSCLEQHKEFSRQLNNVGAKVSVKPVPLSHRDINLAAADGATQIFRESKAFIESGKF